MRLLYLEIELLYEIYLTVTDGRTRPHSHSCLLYHTLFSMYFTDCEVFTAKSRAGIEYELLFGLTNDWDGKSNCHDLKSRSE